MKIVTICGSMRFAPEMRRAAFRLESRQGCNVLQCTYPEPGETVTAEMRQRLEEAHLEKIRMSDVIYVVDVGGCVGESVGWRSPMPDSWGSRWFLTARHRRGPPFETGKLIIIQREPPGTLRQEGARGLLFCLRPRLPGRTCPGRRGGRGCPDRPPALGGGARPAGRTAPMIGGKLPFLSH